MTRPLALGLLLALLAACQALPPRPTPRPDASALAAIAELSHWQATGRVAVRAGEAGYSAGFDWRQSGVHAELGVRGPFGAGAVRISLGPDRIRIESGDAAPTDVAAPFASLEQELTARLGFPLPLDPLRYWMLGVPAPGLPVAGADDGFQQGGWDVALGEYVPVAGAPGPLPGRITLTRDATRIRVIVDRWGVGAP